MLVWVVYALGIVAVAIPLLVAAVMTAVVYFSSDLVVGIYVSPVTIVVWVGVILLAAATWFWRRFGARQ